jgi:hypothetical protein
MFRLRSVTREGFARMPACVSSHFLQMSEITEVPRKFRIYTCAKGAFRVSDNLYVPLPLDANWE